MVYKRTFNQYFPDFIQKVPNVLKYVYVSIALLFFNLSVQTIPGYISNQYL